MSPATRCRAVRPTREPLVDADRPQADASRSPCAAALGIQAVALTMVFAGAAAGSALVGLRAPPLGFACVAAAAAVWLAHRCGQARWWLVMHAGFAPAAWLLLQVPIPPWVFLAAALLLALTQSNAGHERVPLFLSSRRAVDVLIRHLPASGRLRFLELGSGFGGVAMEVVRRRPGVECTGVETAPLPHGVGVLRNALHGHGCNLVRRDLWQTSLAEYDVVYAYLSPAPMGRLWHKALAEMKPGALLISNSFPVPGAEPAFAVKIDDLTRAVLYGYRIPEASGSLAADAVARTGRCRAGDARRRPLGEPSVRG